MSLKEGFSFSEEKSTLKLSAKDYDLAIIKKLSKLIFDLNQNRNIKKVNIVGNFNSKLILNTLIDKKLKKKKILENLDFLQSFSKSIEESPIVFISNLKGIVQGPALEIALSCDYIRAYKNTTIKLQEIDRGFMPFFGSIQRLLRLLGYNKTLKALLINKLIDYDEIKRYLIDYKNKVTLEDLKKEKYYWDINFTNTFIYYNSVIHSKTKNKIPSYNAILSSIYEGCICGYKASLSIEKKWLLWLICKSLSKN